MQHSGTKSVESLQEELRQTQAQLTKLIQEQEKTSTLLIRKELELSRMHDKVQTLDKVKTEFIAIASHQLRTPLSAIKWILHMALHGEFIDENERLQYIQKAYDSTERMIGLVNDLLEVDHIQSGKDKIEIGEVDMHEVLHSILINLAAQIEQKQLQITQTLSHDSHVMGDAKKLRAICRNLVENAIKYTLKGGTIHFTTTSDTQFLHVSIKDSGIGIPEDQQDQLFKKFFRADNAIKVETVGSGLGLFIAKELIEKQGGKISFKSKVGEGTTFFISLPLAVDTKKA